MRVEGKTLVVCNGMAKERCKYLVSDLEKAFLVVADVHKLARGSGNSHKSSVEDANEKLKNYDTVILLKTNEYTMKLFAQIADVAAWERINVATIGFDQGVIDMVTTDQIEGLPRPSKIFVYANERDFFNAVRRERDLHVPDPDLAHQSVDDVKQGT